jgi:hypothetical protein
MELCFELDGFPEQSAMVKRGQLVYWHWKTVSIVVHFIATGETAWCFPYNAGCTNA